MRAARFPFLIAIFLGAFGRLSAEVRLPTVFSDHAVLQRDSPIHIWGWASGSESVTVKFHAQSETTHADAVGLWDIWLSQEEAGGPYTLKVSGNSSAKEVQVTDILVGDVWIASGQSNMEIPLKGFNKDTQIRDGDKEIAAATNPNLRLLLVRKRTSAVSLQDGTSVWTQCTPETARDFSAVAYFFGREISTSQGVPVGLIDDTWGGTPAHAWISLEGIADHDLISVFESAGRVATEQGKADEIKALNNFEDDALRSAGKPVPVHGRIPGDHQGTGTPGTLYNGMIAPYTRYTMKGVIWYQGEQDTAGSLAGNYASVFRALIEDWRKQWNQGPFPFLFVQLSSYGNEPNLWGTVRDAQRRTLELANTGMAVSLDVGQRNNIHPPDKQSVGHRLALIARGEVYGEKTPFASPLFIKANQEGNNMRVWLSHAEGLGAKGKLLPDDFEIAGADGKFVQATTIEIHGSTILVSSSSIPDPRYVRYGWASTVTSYIYNTADLPLGTFTSMR